MMAGVVHENARFTQKTKRTRFVSARQSPLPLLRPHLHCRTEMIALIRLPLVDSPVYTNHLLPLVRRNCHQSSLVLYLCAHLNIQYHHLPFFAMSALAPLHRPSLSRCQKSLHCPLFSPSRRRCLLGRATMKMTMSLRGRPLLRLPPLPQRLLHLRSPSLRRGPVSFRSLSYGIRAMRTKNILTTEGCCHRSVRPSWSTRIVPCRLTPIPRIYLWIGLSTSPKRVCLTYLYDRSRTKWEVTALSTSSQSALSAR